MKRITYWALSTLSVLLLLFGYHTSTSGPSVGATSSIVSPISSSPSSAASSSATPTPSTKSSASSGSPAAASSAAPATTSSTVTGNVIQTRWGPVQVQLTVANKKITNVSVVQYPNGNDRDAQINSYALPALIQETMSAQNAHIDMVSGATYTSDGYIQSLQSALDQANL